MTRGICGFKAKLQISTNFHELFVLTLTMGHPNQKLEGEKGLELTLLLCHEHDASVLCAVGERHRNL